MSTELIINASLPETRIALLENGEIQELLIERASGRGIVGNIYKGKVSRVLPGMQAAFIDIGLEKAAFLYVDDVYTQPEIWEEEEEVKPSALAQVQEATGGEMPASASAEATTTPEGESITASNESTASAAPAETDLGDVGQDDDFGSDDEEDDADELLGAHDDEGDEDEDESGDHERMAPEGDGNEPPSGTIAPPSVPASSGGESGGGGSEPVVITGGAAGGSSAAGSATGNMGGSEEGRRGRRGRRGGRNRHRRDREGGRENTQPRAENTSGEPMPESFSTQVSETGETSSDRSSLSGEGGADPAAGRLNSVDRSAFNAQRSKDRRIRPKQSLKPSKANINIQDLLKEGQEVIVQVAKDPISTKGARLTCHISLPGRHLVCMPTIDHVGVSRRIDNDGERKKLRQLVEANRPKGLGFIVRTASGRGQAEKRVKQDIDYLTNLWNEIKAKANEVTAPALVYADLNPMLRAIRDWVTEDINRIVVDSRYHHADILKFVAHFMPSLREQVELYQGSSPIFDAFNISSELSRALERKVWLKSGGYIVVDQAEALVAIDVNTGRYVGKKNLEDTILKTNLEAVQEIAYQLRLRNCGGIIVLDLIDMEKEENKQRVYKALDEALKKDRARPSILKISELGLIEMTRKRTRDTMVRSLCEPCTHCEGRGYMKSRQTVAYEALREIERSANDKDMTKILVQAHPDVIDLLAIEERDTLDQLERRSRKQIFLQAVTDFQLEQVEVIGDKREGSAQLSIPVGRGRDRNRSRERDSNNNNREGRNRNRDRDRDRSRRSGQGQGQGGQGHSNRPAAPAVAADGATPATAAPAEPRVFESEEDRLAFLRAQATQDAALATGAPAAGNGPGGAGQGNGQRRENGRKRRRGRRGGRFRNRERDTGPGASAPSRAGASPGIVAAAPASGGDSAPSSGGGGGGGEGSSGASSPLS